MDKEETSNIWNLQEAEDFITKALEIKQSNPKVYDSKLQKFLSKIIDPTSIKIKLGLGFSADKTFQFFLDLYLYIQKLLVNDFVNVLKASNEKKSKEVLENLKIDPQTIKSNLLGVKDDKYKKIKLQKQQVKDEKVNYSSRIYLFNLIYFILELDKQLQLLSQDIKNKLRSDKSNGYVGNLFGKLELLTLSAEVRDYVEQRIPSQVLQEKDKELFDKFDELLGKGFAMYIANQKCDEGLQNVAFAYAKKIKPNHSTKSEHIYRRTGYYLLLVQLAICIDPKKALPRLLNKDGVFDIFDLNYNNCDQNLNFKLLGQILNILDLLKIEFIQRETYLEYLMKQYAKDCSISRLYLDEINDALNHFRYLNLDQIYQTTTRIGQIDISEDEYDSAFEVSPSSFQYLHFKTPEGKIEEKNSFEAIKNSAHPLLFVFYQQLWQKLKELQLKNLRVTTSEKNSHRQKSLEIFFLQLHNICSSELAEFSWFMPLKKPSLGPEMNELIPFQIGDEGIEFITSIDFVVRYMYPFNPDLILYVQKCLKGSFNTYAAVSNNVTMSVRQILVVRMLNLIAEMFEKEIENDRILKDPFSFLFDFKGLLRIVQDTDEQHFSQEELSSICNAHARLAKLLVKRIGQVDKNILEQNKELIRSGFCYILEILATDYKANENDEKLYMENYFRLLHIGSSKITSNSALHSKMQNKQIEAFLQCQIKEYQEIQKKVEEIPIQQDMPFESEEHENYFRNQMICNLLQESNVQSVINNKDIEELNQENYLKTYNITPKKATSKQLQRQIGTCLSDVKVNLQKDLHLESPINNIVTRESNRPSLSMAYSIQEKAKESRDQAKNQEANDSQKNEEEKAENSQSIANKEEKTSQILSSKEEETSDSIQGLTQNLQFKFFLTERIGKRNQVEQKIEKIRNFMSFYIGKLISYVMTKEFAITETYQYTIDDCNEAFKDVNLFDTSSIIYYLQYHLPAENIADDLSQLIQQINNEYTRIRSEPDFYITNLKDNQDKIKQFDEPETIKTEQIDQSEFSTHYNLIDNLKKMKLCNPNISIYTDTNNYHKSKPKSSTDNETDLKKQPSLKNVELEEVKNEESKDDEQLQTEEAPSEIFEAGSGFANRRIFFYDDLEIAGLFDLFNLPDYLFQGSNLEKALQLITRNPVNGAKFYDFAFFILIEQDILVKERNHPIIKHLQRSSKDSEEFIQNLLGYIERNNDTNYLRIDLASVKTHRIKLIDDLKLKYKYDQKVNSCGYLIDILAEYHFNYVSSHEASIFTKVLQKINFENYHHLSEYEKNFGYPVSQEFFEQILNEQEDEEELQEEEESKNPKNEKSKLIEYKNYLKNGSYSVKSIPSFLVCVMENLINRFNTLSDEYQKAIDEIRSSKSIDILSDSDSVEYQHLTLQEIEILLKMFQEMTSTIFSHEKLKQSADDQEFQKMFDQSIETIDICLLVLEHEDIKDRLMQFFELLDLNSRFNTMNIYVPILDTLIKIAANYSASFCQYYSYCDTYKRQNKYLAQKSSLTGQDETKKSPLMELAQQLISKISAKAQDTDEIPLPTLIPNTISEIRENVYDNLKSEHLFILFAKNYNTQIKDMSEGGENKQVATYLISRYKWLFDAKTQVSFRTRADNYREKLNVAGTRDININKENLTLSFMTQLNKMSRKDMLAGVNVVFEGEMGIDAGGLRRELYDLAGQEIFNPKFGLFKIGEGSDHNLIINPDSIAIPYFTKYYEYAGILIGKAMLQEFYVNAPLSRYLLKTLLGKKLSISDLQDIDTKAYESLKYMLDNEGTAESLCIDFTYEGEILGNKFIKSLVPDGANIMVDDSNMMLYVRLYCEAKMIFEAEPQLNAFLRGFRNIIPLHLVEHMTPADLESQINGPCIIDVELMKKTCSSGYAEDSEFMKWFWEILFAFDQSQLGKFMFFLSGSSKPPFGGFTAQYKKRLQIDRHGDTDRLPVAHTCFLSIDLPSYSSKEILEEKLLMAMYNSKDFYIG